MTYHGGPGDTIRHTISRALKRERRIQRAHVVQRKRITDPVAYQQAVDDNRRLGIRTWWQQMMDEGRRPDPKIRVLRDADGRQERDRKLGRARRKITLPRLNLPDPEDET